MSCQHSFIVITFNHEQWLRRSLDSIFLQKELPYEVIVGDDCSTDKTREILDEYQLRYPNIVKLKLHPVNVGIYANINSLRLLVTGEVVHLLAGDDWFQGELIADMNRIISENKLNVASDSFLIMTNFYRLENNKLNIVDNYRYKNIDPVTAKIQNLISNREIGMSRALYDQTPDFNESVGMWADWLWDIGRIIRANETLFVDNAYPVYRVGVGVTSNISQVHLNASYIKTIDEIVRQYGKRIGYANLFFLKMQRARSKYINDQSVANFFSYIAILLVTIPLFKSLSRLFREFMNIPPRKLKVLIKGLLR